MEIDKERLKVIGKLIGIYRDELRDNSQNEYTMKKFCEDICSVNTLKTIESGGLGRSDEVYVALLDKLDLKLGYFPVIDNTINKIMVDLYKAIEYSEIDEINVLTTKIMRLLEKVKMYVYYSELYKMMEDTRKNYLDATMIYSIRYIRYSQLYEIMDKSFSNIIIILLFNYIKREYMNDIDKCKEFFDIYQIRTNELISIKSMMLYYYIISSQYMQMKILVDELVEELLQTNNKVKLIDVFSYGILMRSYIDSDHIFEYIEKQEELSKSMILSNFKKREMYSFIGNSLHNLKYYQKALEYYNKCLDLKENYVLIDLIYMADCQNRLGLTVKLPEIEKITYDDQPTDIRLIYNYFLNTDIPNFAKENYIIKEIAPALLDEGFIKVFRFEIDKLVEKTGHYKLLYSFEKILEKNLDKNTN